MEDLLALDEFKVFRAEDVEQSIAQRFEKQVLLYPDRKAICDGETSWSYEALNKRANQIARQLHALRTNATSNQVAIYFEKSGQYIAAILGVLKAGFTYVPIDPSFPSSRNNYIIHDSCVSLVLTNSLYLEEASSFASSSVSLLNLEQALSGVDDSDLGLDISPDALAYIIYTSGSTGKPKGVMQNHRNTLHGCMRRTNLQHVTPSDRLSLFYSCSVMGSVYCIFGALLNGASLHPYDFRVQGIDELAEWLQKNKITIYHSVASVFRPFALGYNGSSDGFFVRLVIFGGERVLTSDVDLARKVFSQNVCFYTGLGSTETGTLRYYPIKPETIIDSKVVPIGYPVDDMEVELLGADGCPVSDGEVGEIVVKSRFLALGYWNDPEATQKVFGQDPSDPALRTYHMGDMAALTKGGLLEHRGRKDFQVKIRGFRVEIGEVETALLEVEGIAEALVVSRELDQEVQLVAYIVAKEGLNLTVRPLRKKLLKRLPYYMVPAIYVGLTELPRTPNNKVDRARLPLVLPSNQLEEEACVDARDTLDQKLLNICIDLLKKTEIGINQNFFDLGGHSLLATQLIARVNDSFGVKVSMRTIFEVDNLASLADIIRSRLEREVDSFSVDPQKNMGHAPSGKKCVLSFAQERMWLIDKLYGGSSAYNISNSIRLVGRLNVPALQQSINEIVNRHEVLRTIFPSDNKGPWQEVLPKFHVNLPIIDLSENVESDAESKALERVHSLLHTRHDLAKGPLFFCELIVLEENTHILALVFNHIVYDNIWSSGLFFKELGSLYQHFSKGESEASPYTSAELPFQFVDYAFWERARIERESLDSPLEYWRHQLAELPEPLQMPFDRIRPPVQSFKGGQVEFTVPASVCTGLAYLSHSASATSYMTLLAVWKVLLHRYSQQNDVLVGSPTGRRYRAESEDMIGLFINNLVMRTKFSGNPTFRELLQSVRKTTIDAFSFDELPFEELVRELRPVRTAGESPFFQNLFIHRNASHSQWSIPGLELCPLSSHQGGAKFDLTMSILEDNNQLSGTLEYSSDLYDHSTVSRMVANYLSLLGSVVENPNCAIWDLELVSTSEKQLLLESWNSTVSAYPKELGVHQLFEQQVAQCPSKTAIIEDEGEVSYSELNSRVNILANHLVNMGVLPGQLVAVCLDRSANLVTTLLAVLKTGAAYVPLDPFFPTDRLQYMVEDSNAVVFVSDSSIIQKFGKLTAKTLLLDEETELFAGQPQNNPPAKQIPSDLAYVIYTSGSTGKPKGVQLTHQSLVNFLCSMQEKPGITSEDVFHSLTTVCFDISALEIFLPLISGAQLVMKRREVSLDPEQLISSLISSGSTILQATPATWRMLLDYGWTGASTIKVLCGGEAMGEGLEESLIACGGEVWNLYGPTETTIWSSVGSVKNTSDSAVIGQAIANTEMYIVSKNMTLQPIGVPGELLIGGDGLARGYINRPQLTEEKFIPHLFSEGRRLYRTGDLAVRGKDSSIKFLGRIDNQIKLRGYRIELGEIESAISAYQGVKQNVVVALNGPKDDKRLVSYIVFHALASSSGSEEAHTDMDGNAIRVFLQEFLPDYMIPSFFIALDSFPLTPNGKVDRKQLPTPNFESNRESNVSLELDDTSAALVSIFERLLGVKVPSLTSSFFELGGHSLLALNTVSEVNAHFTLKLSPMTIFNYPSVEKLGLIVKEELLSSGSSVSEDSSSFDLIFPIDVRGPEAPLFLVSGAHQDRYYEIGVSKYEEDVYRYFGVLINSLGYARPLYGFRPKGIVFGEDFHSSVEEMASEYIKLMKNVQKKGPYNIGGECVGGIVAYEMARQLIDSGEVVGALIMMDTHLPTQRYQRVEKIRTQARRIKFRLGSLLTTFKQKGIAGFINELTSTLYALLVFIAPITKNMAYKKNALFGSYIYLNLLWRYRPQVISAPVTLIVNEVTLKKKPALGWGELNSKNISVVKVPGDHKTRLSLHGDSLGAVINKLLSLGNKK